MVCIEAECDKSPRVVPFKSLDKQWPDLTESFFSLSLSVRFRCLNAFSCFLFRTLWIISDKEKFFFFQKTAINLLRWGLIIWNVTNRPRAAAAAAATNSKLVFCWLGQFSVGPRPRIAQESERLNNPINLFPLYNRPPDPMLSSLAQLRGLIWELPASPLFLCGGIPPCRFEFLTKQKLSGPGLSIGIASDA